MHNPRGGRWEDGAFLPMISVSELAAAQLAPQFRSSCSPAALKAARARGREEHARFHQDACRYMARAGSKEEC